MCSCRPLQKIDSPYKCQCLSSCHISETRRQANLLSTLSALWRFSSVPIAFAGQKLSEHTNLFAICCCCMCSHSRSCSAVFHPALAGIQSYMHRRGVGPGSEASHFPAGVRMQPMRTAPDSGRKRICVCSMAFDYGLPHDR